MQVFKYNKLELIEVLRKNRATHVEDVTIAKEGYRLAVLKRLKALTKKVKSGAAFNLSEVYADLPEVHDHIEDYDLVIKMLESAVDTQVELTSHEFNQYVNDNWAWTLTAKHNNSLYADGVASAVRKKK